MKLQLIFSSQIYKLIEVYIALTAFRLNLKYTLIVVTLVFIRRIWFNNNLKKTPKKYVSKNYFNFLYSVFEVIAVVYITNLAFYLSLIMLIIFRFLFDRYNKPRVEIIE